MGAIIAPAFVWGILGALLVLAWRLLSPLEAVLATFICGAAAWLKFHPTTAAHLLAVVGQLRSQY